MLVDDRDAPFAGLEGRKIVDQLTANVQLAIIRSDGPGDDPDQRRLPGAVLANEGVDLSGPETQGRPAERPDPGKGLGQTIRPQKIRSAIQ